MNPVIGGNKPSDFHVWVADKDTGNILYDPRFEEHEAICKKRKLDIDSPQYFEWTDPEYKVRLIPYTKAINSLSRTELIMYTPKFNRCIQNSIVWMKLMKPENAKLCIGSFGWQRKNKKGTWWEFG